ncbi:MAG: DEAD/DEAH box helicase family protein [Caldisericia bacterium]
MFNPLPFQRETIDKLLATLTELWKKDGKQLPLVFKSPTGSGKTFMMAYFVRGLNKLPNWDMDKAFIWITFSDDLAMQSKKKFEEYFENTLENNLLTVNDINRGKMLKNNILFLNWQKVSARSAESRILRRPDDENMRKESGKYFEDFIDGTKKNGRAIILIIDEAHTHVKTELAQQIVDYIDPKIVVHVSATPNDEIELIARRDGGFVDVDRKQVVAEGLIKEKIITQTEEDLKRFQGKDLDEALLDLGLEKREELKEEFEKLSKKINPLLLIQLPNDDNERVQAGEKTKEQITSEYLKKKGIKENKIGRWFDDHPKPNDIEDNEDEHDVLLFKLAAGTGWDCPRAHVLVMFRNVRVEQRYIQTVGRILRMPEPDLKEDYKNNPNLRVGYLYTNYNRKDITDNWIDKSQNKPFVYVSKRKKGINNIQLQSAYVSRVDYGDLSNSAKFQASFIKSMNGYFGIDKDDILGKAEKKLAEKGFDLAPSITNQIIVDAQFEDYDRINFEFQKKGRDISIEISQNDAEKTFNYLCWQLLKEQTEDEARITNIARSWSPLKSAIRVWMKNVLGENSDYYYRVFIKDNQKGAASVFRPAITQALKDYRPILEKILNERVKKNEEKEAPIFTIQERYSYTDDYENLPLKLNVLEKFYIRKEYDGKPNEIEFINYIDNKKNRIEWWFKQEIGQEYFAIKYFNTADQKYALFYPDWIIKFKDEKTGIFDTKSGRTATDTEGRAPALAEKLKELGKKYIGGIVVKEGGVWHLNDSKDYKYIPGKLDTNWKKLEDLFL